MEQCDCWGWLIGGGGMRETYGDKIVDRALELSRGCHPEANFMPYIQMALDEARAADSADDKL